jgi:hypothetical protein
MDPLGFALEHYDAVGRYRDVDEARSPVDASGTLPTGAQFTGLPGLRSLLAERRDRFAETVSERLLTFALGRGIEHYDRPALRRIVRDAAATGYRWSSIIEGIINSAPFQMRRSES